MTAIRLVLSIAMAIGLALPTSAANEHSVAGHGNHDVVATCDPGGRPPGNDVQRRLDQASVELVDADRSGCVPTGPSTARDNPVPAVATHVAESTDATSADPATVGTVAPVGEGRRSAVVVMGMLLAFAAVILAVGFGAVRFGRH